MSSTKITKHDVDDSLIQELSPTEHIETHQLQTYTSLEQIGITVGEETIDGIMAALPNNSMLMFHVTSSNNASQYPTTTATCIIYKSMDSRTSLTLEAANTSRRWFAEHYNASGNITWTGWKELFTTEGGTLSGQTYFNNGFFSITPGNNVFTDLTLYEDNVNKSNGDFRGFRILGNSAQADFARAFDLIVKLNGEMKNYLIYGEHNITKSTTGVTANSTALASGCIHLTYE